MPWAQTCSWSRLDFRSIDQSIETIEHLGTQGFEVGNYIQTERHFGKVRLRLLLVLTGSECISSSSSAKMVSSHDWVLYALPVVCSPPAAGTSC